MDRFSFLNAAHTAYFAELYDQYLQSPDSVEPSWRAFFQGFDFGMAEYGDFDQQAAPDQEADHVFVEPSTGSEVKVPEAVLKELQVVQLIDGYRTRGHLFTKTNPVRERRKYTPTLDIENFGLSEADLDNSYHAGAILDLGKSTLREILQHLKDTYCDAIGIEYMYIREPEEIQWIQKRVNNYPTKTAFGSNHQKEILRKLNEAVEFEGFLHRKYVGQKRFSLEGNETLIPALDELVEKAAHKGVREFVLGMAHRGRLNTLTNIFGKSPQKIFGEFEGKDYQEKAFDGDVKYHLGWTSKRKAYSGEEINLNLAPNPSHLEAVGPVVQGMARSKQDRHYQDNPEHVLPIIVHGDAAISGQGAAYETVQMAQLEGYKTHGSIHIVVNNQIGFTTNYLDGRSSTYCTDIAKVTLSPVLHVNADDPEAVVRAMNFALDFRMEFQRDVFIDLLGYRKYGHNEGDEPRFTQPKLYKAISRHPNTRDLYAEKLKEDKLIDDGYVDDLIKDYKDILEKDLESSKKQKNTVIQRVMQDEWEDYSTGNAEDMMKPADTTVKMDVLNNVAEELGKVPGDKKFMRKVKKLIKARHAMYFDDNQLDWGMAELLAYGTLMKEGHDVRLTGQDSERGTFSHRHAVLTVEDDEENIVPLNEMEGDHGHFHIYNSLLSEYAVVGFDYGYAMASPNTLSIWEAQFGDFSNGAQIMIDQYFSSAEDKWKLQNGLTLFLPHGYEGQGAEHSSGRMERYLQLCARDNMFVTNCTTPANMFHLLRRQVKLDFRKPLIVFTPKSLLRHPKVKSTKEEFAKGQFETLIDDPDADPKKVESVVFCSGKFYYDLLDKKEKDKRDDVALVRLEQLFPLPKKELNAIIDKYDKAVENVWAQEEPRNMGAYSHLLLRFEKMREFRVCSRHFYGAPAAGSKARFERRQKNIIDSVFDKSKRK